MLSTKAVDLGPAGYHQVLAGHFERYAFIEHHNTEFPHAHVIGFRTQRVKKAELQALRGRVLELEQARAQSQQLDHTHVPGHAPAEHARVQPHRDRGHDISGPGGG